MTISVLTFLSSSDRFGIATTLVPESGLIEGKVNEEFFSDKNSWWIWTLEREDTYYLITATIQICQQIKKNSSRMRKELRTLKFCLSVYDN